MSKFSTEGVLIGCDSLLISLFFFFFFLGLSIISISNPSLSLVGDGTTISSCLSSSSSLSVTTTTDDDDGITHQLQQDFSNTVSEYNITIIIVNYYLSIYRDDIVIVLMIELTQTLHSSLEDLLTLPHHQLLAIHQL